MAHHFLKNGVSFVKMSNLPVNGLSLAVRDGLLKALDQARINKSAGLVIFGDGKNFCAGADITEFASGKFMHEPDLNMVLASMDDFERPLVAAIDGVALGGGLEVALTCHWRLASPQAMVGLPEVHLGILPGAGGTQRLPRLVGVEKALDLMTSGRNVKAAEALQLGILDSLASHPFATHDDLIDTASEFILSDRVQSVSVESRRVSGYTVPGDVSAELLAGLEKKTASLQKKTGFIAPSSIFQAVKASVELPFKQGRAREQELFSALARGSQAPAMQYAFFAERVATAPPKLDKDAKVPAVNTVGVIGGGTMGAGIAMVMANAGIPVTLVETSEELATAAQQRIESTYKMSSSFKSGKMTAEKLSKTMSSFTFASDLSSLSKADLVVEAVFENMAVKKDIFAQLDKICKDDAILATNTSFMDVDEIARATSRPASVVGTHFFAPANVMKLLEIVRGAGSSPENLAACVKLGKKVGKMPVIAGNCFGFIGNRMVDIYGKEAMFLVEEGASPAQVDRVLREQLGMAMGLFEMSDLSGNDVGWRLRLDFGFTGEGAAGPDPAVRYSSLPDKLCERGWFGQKTKQGWYKYDPAAPRTPLECAETAALIDEHREASGLKKRDISDEEILQRCMFSLVNEGYKILEEGISKGPEDIDMVYIYGYGFPRYRGGPMFWAEKEQGLEKVLRALQAHYEAHPQQPWLKPAGLLEEAVKNQSSIKKQLEAMREKR